MKYSIFNISLIATLLVFQSFTNPNASEEKSIEVINSKIVWKAYKVAGSHQGTVDLKSGSLSFTDEQLTGGTFVMAMTTITCTDLEGEYKGKLEGHLKSADFFGVDQHETATLEIIKVESAGKNSYEVTGDLTIKGITKKIDFQVSIYGNKATANLKIDRTMHDIKYGSGSFFEGLKDNMIYDEFDMIIDLEF